MTWWRERRARKAAARREAAELLATHAPQAALGIARARMRERSRGDAGQAHYSRVALVLYRQTRVCWQPDTATRYLDSARRRVREARRKARSGA